MILAACGGRGNGEKDAEGLARAESGAGSGKWEVGRVDRKEGWMATGGWRQGGGNLEGGLGRQRLSHSLIATSTWNACVE